MDKHVFIISFIVFVNVLGVGLILPLLPFFAENLGATPLTIGFFIATLPFFSILTGPALGILSDKYGRKPILLFSIAGTVVGFFLLGIAKTLPLLFLSRAIDGASAGNISTAKAAIADLTAKEERVTKLGFTFAAESLGLILGPVLGGLFSQYGFTLSAFVATTIAIICLLLTLFFFPETRGLSAQPTEEKKKGWLHRNDLLKVILNPMTQDLVLIVFIVQLLIMMMWGTLALYGKYLFGLTGKEIGYISSFAALVGISSQAGLLKFITRVAKEKAIIVMALLTMSTAMMLLAFSKTVIVLLIGVGLMAACFNVAMPTVVGLVSKRSLEGDQGNVMGTTSSAISAASLIGPVFANGIFSISMRGNYMVAGAFGIVAVFLTFTNIKNEGSQLCNGV